MVKFEQDGHEARTAMLVRPMLVPPGVTPIRRGPMEMPTGEMFTPVASAWIKRGEMLIAMGSTWTPAQRRSRL